MNKSWWLFCLYFCETLAQSQAHFDPFVSFLARWNIISENKKRYEFHAMYDNIWDDKDVLEIIENEQKFKEDFARIESEEKETKNGRHWQKEYTILENISMIKEDESFIHVIKLACYYPFHIVNKNAFDYEIYISEENQLCNEEYLFS